MKNELFAMYTSDNMGCNDLCKKCKSNTNVCTNALSAWLICKNAGKYQNILFVGKVARGDDIGIKINDSLEDVTTFGEKHIKTSSWPYWNYTKAIIENVYGNIENGLNYVTFTNMIKCNNKTNSDSTANIAKDYCIRQNMFIWKEIEILKPKVIVFYTNYYYDEYIKQFIPSYATEYIDKKDMVTIGAKNMPWWERHYFNVSGNIVLKILRVGHPQYKKKNEYVNKITEWIKLNK